MTRVVVAIIRIYQIVLSPLLGSRCRFHPSCSSYAMESFQAHGFFGGLRWTVRRILKCHPWNEGGFDPVPKAGGNQAHG